jgi:hypothetical protein
MDEINWKAEAEMDPIIHAMIGAGIPLTREHYIEMKYGAPGTEDHPDDWTEDHEMSLPAPFQRGAGRG